MYQINFSHPVHVHFVGIGGISMSGLAQILASEGFTVSGSDRAASEITRALEDSGIRVMIGQRRENITKDIDLAVFTAAIHPDNPEYKAVQEMNIPALTRAELLGQLMRNYRLPVAVSGTHGKTTTTSMLSEILLAAGTDPTLSIGGVLPSIGGNVRVGGGTYFVAEACEYTNSFLQMYPLLGIILNIEEDHLDFFKDLDDIASSFHRFALLLDEGGTLILNRDTARFEEVSEGLSCELITYSLEQDADYTASDICFDERGHGSFTCLERGEELGRFTLRVPGIHNVSNALSAIALGRKLGLTPSCIASGLLSFSGTERRFQHKGKLGGAEIIDDYAHHPSEIRATIKAARQCPHKRLIIAFQPHTYTRTKALLAEFADALSAADRVVLADIYAAREKNTIGISSRDLMTEIRKRGTAVDYFPSFAEIEDLLRSELKEGDLLITMGAGNIVDIGEDLLRT